jgi:hypothetical protein
MDRPARRAALAAACALLGLLGLLPTTASATNLSYCGALIGAGGWCGDGSNRFYTYNSASYTGGGSVWVCELLMIADSGTQRANPVCAYNFAAATFGPYGSATEAYVTHYTGANHTIYGLASY